jgi:adenine-specific DNA-methyltransferase
MASGTKAPKHVKSKPAKTYRHPESESPMRPEVGTQAQFKKKLPPKKYRYDDSLSPVMEWDGQNPARERGEARIANAETELAEALKKLNGKSETKEATAHIVAAQKAVGELRAMSKPFLNWAGKAERQSFDVPTLPLFIHERLSTKAILDTLKGHKRDKQTDMFDLFGDPQHSITDQVLRAYEHKDKWVNRMILGDSLVVMNSLLRYESLGSQVEMIYIDPPYGVRFGSNFQPFVRKRDVSHNDDEDMTREPEMVQAYRDTWELGLHSYLTYLRDRLLLARELLSPSGSVFVQINDENVHSVRDVLTEVFGRDNFIITLLLKKKGGQKGETLDPINDYILWFVKDKQRARTKIKKMYLPVPREEMAETFRYVELPDGRELTITELSKEKGFEYRAAIDQIEKDFPGAKLFASENLTSGGFRRTQSVKYAFRDAEYDPGIAKGNCWKHSAITDDGSPSGLDRLAKANRLFVGDKQLRFKRYAADFGFTEVTNWWDEFGGAPNPIYAVQTNSEVVKRCILMTTEPGDLVIDPTCGSGTTAYCAEQWGRRWITIDTSRVPLALARQRLLTATYNWYELSAEARGPAGGFSYKTKQNRKGEQIGGIVPHITSSTIANDESPQQEVLADRPEIEGGVTRVTGPFCVEATIPTPMDLEATEARPTAESTNAEADGSFVDRMIEILRKSPVLRLEGNRTVTVKNVRSPAKSLSLSAEALVDATAPGQRPTLEEATQEAAERDGKTLVLSSKLVAFVFGPENGAVNEGLVWQAAKEASAKNYTHLYVTGFAIQPNARELIEKCEQVVGIPATYVQATPDLMMGDLLKNMRSSQVFSVCGMPEAELRRTKAQGKNEPPKYEVELLGIDVFDPTTMEVLHRSGEEVPAWFLDTDYNGLCFHVSQAFFPKTGAWENLKRALRSDYEQTVWDHLAGTVSAPFEADDHRQVAVKVIDERGNELLIVKPISEARK